MYWKTLNWRLSEEQFYSMWIISQFQKIQKNNERIEISHNGFILHPSSQELGKEGNYPEKWLKLPLLSIREAETLDDVCRISIEIQLPRGWLHSRWEPVALVSDVRVQSWPSRQSGRKDGCEVGDTRTDWNLRGKAGIHEDRWTHVAFSLLPRFSFPG